MKRNKILLLGILIVSILVFPDYSNASCNGKISRYKRSGIPGTSIDTIPTNTIPNQQGTYTSLEIPKNTDNNYGIMLEGKICPTETANYIFYISSDDDGELRLSDDTNRNNATKIAYVKGRTSNKQRKKYSSQKSISKYLEAGKEYYIKALMKEGGGGDNLAIGRENDDKRWSLINIIDGENIGELKSICGNNILEPGEFCDGPTNPCNEGLICNNSCICEIDKNICAAKIDNTIKYEEWTGIGGNDLNSVPWNTTPNLTGKYNTIEAPTHTRAPDSFGRRVSGYICVPVTGEYTFYIASDDKGELWISNDKSKNNKIKRATVPSRTNERERFKYANDQESEAITLQKGKLYYIEVLMKEGGYGDNLAIGRKTPFHNNIKVIGSSFISSTISNECGNGIIESGEICDDKNTNNGDGCSDTCTVEYTHICDRQSPSVCREKILQIQGNQIFEKEYQVSKTQQIITIPANNILKISDEKGDEDTWYITVSASNLSGKNHIITNDNIKIKINALNTISGITNNNIAIVAGAENYQNLSGPLTIINKSAGINNGGIGQYNIDSNIQITIPAYQNIDRYHSVLTFTLYE